MPTVPGVVKDRTCIFCLYKLARDVVVISWRGCKERMSLTYGGRAQRPGCEYMKLGLVGHMKFGAQTEFDIF